MTNKQYKELQSVEERLSALGGPDTSVWARMRGELAERANAAGLIDVAFERHDSPLGTIVLGATTEGLVRVGLPAEGEDVVLDELAERISPRVLHCARESVTRARRQLDEYFNGQRQRFDVPLDWRLTKGFRREVLRATAQIPYGHTASYREVATEAGNPAAVRAVGSALATNPLPIIIPCHRVLPAAGGLGNYLGGAAAKAQLLSLEHGA